MADLRVFSNTSNLVRFTLKNASTGVGLTGLTEASSGLIISTIIDNEATTTRYRAGSSEIETIATLGTFAAPSSSKCRFKEVDATNHKGLYEFQFADARFAVASGRRMVVSVTGATNLLDADYEIQLTQINPYDSVRAGLTSLPNAAAEAAGGLYTRGSGAGQINQTNNGQVDANAARTGGTTNTGRDIGASVLLSSGTGTGQLKLASGYVAMTWADVAAPTTAVDLSGTTIKTTQKVDVETIKTNPVVNGGTITFPTTATLASTTNITAGTVATATNVTTVNGLAANVITASSIAADAIGASELAADAVTEIQLGLATSTALATLQTDVTTLLGRITSVLFTGITSLAQWLGLLGGKQTGNSTARTEMRATGAGGGTFDETTDSVEAVRDRGDAAWVTATGFATAVDYTTARAAKLDNLDATISSRATPAQVNTEADQALADYDGPTHAELTSELATADDSVLAAIAAMNNLSAAQVLTQIQTALTTAVADSIPADGSRPSIAQAAYMNTQFLNERLVAATTVTVYKPDGTTPLFTLTLNDATTPTAVTRAT